MSFDPLLNAPLNIQIHALAAIVALILGPFALYRRRRDRVHKIQGYFWVLAMVTAAMSSFTIFSFPLIGPFSPIHLLSLLAMWSILMELRHIFAGRVVEHQDTMRGLYWRGVCIASLFNFLPDRTINRMFFDEMRELGYLIIAIGAVGLFMQWHFARQRGQVVA